MKKIINIILLFFLISLTSCQSVEVISITEKQYKISSIRDYMLKQSIYDMNTTIYESLTLNKIIGDSFDYLDLLKNELPYLDTNLNKFDSEIHLSYKKSLIEIQQILIKYSDKIEYPLIYPNVENKYIINKNSSTIMLSQFRDELYSEIDNILNENLNKASSLYTSMAKKYNIYCKGLINLNRQSLSIISTNIKPRIKTIFIKILIESLINNENALGLLKTPLEPTKITIN